MRTFRWSTPLVLLAIAVLGMGSIAWRVWNSTYHLEQVLAPLLASALEREVRVESVHIHTLGAIELRGIEIAEKRWLKDGALARLPRTVIRYDWRDILTRKVDPVGSISSVDVYEPTLVIERDASNHFNLEKLFKPSGPPKPIAFRGLVRVHDATVLYRDYHTENLPVPQSNTLRASATVDAGGPPLILFSGTARGDGRRVGDAKVSGSFQPDNGGLRVRVDAKSQTLSYWLPYFVELPQVRLSRGGGTVGVDVWKPDSEAGVSATIDIRVLQAEGTTIYTRAPLQDLSGRIIVRTGDPLSTQLDLRGRSAGIPIGLVGTIFSGNNPRLALRASVENATMASLRSVLGTIPAVPWFQPTSAATADAYIFGPTSDPVITGTASLPSAILYSSQVRDARLNLEYRSGRVHIPILAARTAAGERLTARATYDVSTKRLQVSADVPSVAVKNLGLERLPMTGTATARLLVSGTTEQPETSVHVTVRNGALQDFRFRRLDARVSTKGDVITVHNAVADLPSGVLTAEGVVSTKGDLNLSVQATGIALERLLADLGYQDISGTAFFRGVVAGTLNSPSIQGNARIFHAKVQGQSLDLIAGPIAFSGQRVRFNNVRVARYPSQGRIDGTATIRDDGQLGLDITAVLETGRLETLLADMGLHRHEASGAVEARAAITGTAASPEVIGDVLLTDGTVSGYPVQNASAEIVYRNKALEVMSARALSDDAVITAPLLRLQNRELMGTFSAENLTLAKLGQTGAPYVAMEGTLEIVGGELSGTVDRPLIQTGIRIPDLKINGLAFENTGGRVGWDGAAIEISDFQMDHQAERVVHIPMLRWNNAWGGARGSIRVSSLGLEDLRTILERSTWVRTDEGSAGLRDMLAILPDNLAAELGLNLDFEGRFNDLTANATATAQDVVFGDQNLDELTLTAHLRNGVLDGGRLKDGFLQIEENGLYARHEDEAREIDMVVRGAFEGRLSGSIDKAQIEAFNVPVSYVQPFLPPGRTHNLSGTINTLAITAQGETRSPVLTASLEGSVDYDANGAATEDGEFPTVRVSTEAVTIGNNAISINGIRLTAKGQSAVVKGTLPFRWSPMGIPADGEMNLTASLEQNNLDLLQFLSAASGRRTIRKADGVVSGELRARGTPTAPLLEGFLKVDKGSVDVVGLESGFRDINVHVTFQDDELILDKFHVASTAGGTLEAREGSRIRRLTLTRRPEASDMELRFVPDKFRILTARNALGYGERVRATLESGQLSLLNGFQSPLVQGEITLSDVEITPPNQSPPAIEGEVSSETSPRFDLTLVAGRNVWVQNSLFRIKMDDRVRADQRSLHLGGSLAAPVVTGTLISREGVFNYPTARFRLTDALIEVRYPRPDAGTGQGLPPVYVNANAETRQYTSIAGRRQPVTVYLHIEGPSPGATAGASAFETLAPYRMELRSSPSLPERQLVALISREESLQRLATGEASADQILKQETLNILQASILPEVLSGFETRLSDFFGLEALSLDYETVDRYVNISASKRLFDRLVLTYTTPVASSAAGDLYTFQVSYEITPRLRLTLEDRKGPFLRGSSVPSSVGTNPALNRNNIRETSILLEGGLQF